MTTHKLSQATRAAAGGDLDVDVDLATAGQ